MYPCPVCGYLTFDEPPGSFAICEVCGWEDDQLQLEFATSMAGGANATTLLEAQEAFAELERRRERKHPGTTVPRDRDPGWRPIDPARDRFPDCNDEARERSDDYGEQLYYRRKPV